MLEPDVALDFWNSWRAETNDLNDITFCETAFLYQAWDILGRPQDFQSSLLEGIGKRIFVETARLTRGVHMTQKSLANMGFASAITGTVGALALCDRLSLLPRHTPELLVESGSARKLIGMKMYRPKSLLGRCKYDELDLIWRSPWRLHWNSLDLVRIDIDSVVLDMAQPHRIALDCISRLVMTKPLGACTAPIAILIFESIRKMRGFDVQLWLEALEMSGFSLEIYEFYNRWLRTLPDEVAQVLLNNSELSDRISEVKPSNNASRAPLWARGYVCLNQKRLVVA